MCTVIGFPLGSSTTGIRCLFSFSLETKVFETEDAIQKGADEIDMVLAIGKLKAGEYDYVKNEIHQIHEVCKKYNRILKVIIEIYPLFQNTQTFLILLAISQRKKL